MALAPISLMLEKVQILSGSIERLLHVLKPGGSKPELVSGVTAAVSGDEQHDLVQIDRLGMVRQIDNEVRPYPDGLVTPTVPHVQNDTVDLILPAALELIQHRRRHGCTSREERTGMEPTIR